MSEPNQEEVLRGLIHVIDMQSRIIKILVEEDADKESGYFDACVQMADVEMLRLCLQLRMINQDGLAGALTTSWRQTIDSAKEFASRRDRISKTVWSIWRESQNGASGEDEP